MPRKKEPRSLLNKIIKLIDKDIAVLEEAKGKLKPVDALTLSRYSTTLINIINDLEEAKARDKDKVKKLSNEELEAIAKDLMEKSK